MISFYTREELVQFGFSSVGESVQISRKASIYGAARISLGNHVRVDDFCVLSGEITVGNYVHISAGVYLFAGDVGIVFEDYSGISSRSAVYAISDDYSGKFLVNSTIPIEYRHVISGKVTVGKYSIIGTGCTVLPGVTIGEGCAFGAMSLINRSTHPWGIYYGIPCRRVKERERMCMKLMDKEMVPRSGGGYSLTEITHATWRTRPDGRRAA